MPLALASVLLAASAAAIDLDATDRTALDRGRLIAPLKTPSLPAVTVAWIDPEGTLTDEGAVAMTEEVDALFRAIGIGAEVVRAQPGDPIEAAGVVVPVVARQRQPPSVHPAWVMGLVLRDHAAPSPAWVFVDNVRATLGRGATTASDLGTAVGRVVAHEVIHALAPGHPHASGGLMASTLDRAGLLGRRRPPEAKCVRAVLAGLVALSAARPAPRPAGLVGLLR